ncbi:MAG: hypothetical protein A2Y38_09165 [Spirochaetes bacterium GWB1_59_5]|nr:MAG: hypothetical protein A2Y38_09165 [Spirochaetes bacterium GWB1_59_5]
MKNAASLKDLPGLVKEDAVDLEGIYVESLRQRPRSNRQGMFHPSNIGSCGLRNVYEFTSAEALTTLEPADLEIFDLGHAIHDVVQSRMDNLQPGCPTGFTYTFQREVAFDAETDELFHNYGIGGTTDGVLTFSDASGVQRAVLEVKSINSSGFKDLTAPKPDHLMQATLYAYRFDCPIIYLWYYCKDNSQRMVYARLFNRAVFDAAIARYDGWLEHVHAGTLPPREESWYLCPRCEYRETCRPPSLAKARGSADLTALRNKKL